MKLTPKLLKRLFNIYPPYIGAGVKVEYISGDWKELHVSMALRWYNKNIVGTHFGGSLYSMVDPHLMVLLMQLLGDGYVVWDQSACITFIKAARSKVRAVITVTDDQINDIKHHTANGEKHLSTFTIDIKDDNLELVAKAEKVLYFRKKRTDTDD